MAAVIAAGVGAFLGAQRLALIPGPWSQPGPYGYAGAMNGEAEDYYSVALADDPADYMACYRRGVIFEQRREYEPALADFNQAVALERLAISLNRGIPVWADL